MKKWETLMSMMKPILKLSSIIGEQLYAYFLNEQEAGVYVVSDDIRFHKFD